MHEGAAHLRKRKHDCSTLCPVGDGVGGGGAGEEGGGVGPKHEHEHELVLAYSAPLEKQTRCAAAARPPPARRS